MNPPLSGIAGVVLAGGRASRLGGGDKPLREIGGHALLDLILARFRPQAYPLAINANGDPARFVTYGLPVIADDGPRGSAGPLTGILAALEWAHAAAASQVLTVAGDTPFFPRNLAVRLVAATEGAPDRIAVASSGGRDHPVFALWPTSVRTALQSFLGESETFSVAAFQSLYDTKKVDFPYASFGGSKFDPFFNINTPADLSMAEKLARIDEI